jgi:hypothetical protein
VGEELEERLRAGRFNCDLRHDVKSMSKLGPERVSELVELHRVLIGGLGRLHELILLRRVTAGAFDEHELHATGARLRELYERHQRLLGRLGEIADGSRIFRSRSNWNRLVRDGIIVGMLGSTSTEMIKVGPCAGAAHGLPEIDEVASGPAEEIVGDG